LEAVIALHCGLTISGEMFNFLNAIRGLLLNRAYLNLIVGWSLSYSFAIFVSLCVKLVAISVL